MSKHLREDTECQNCGYTVDKAYCSKCGQKNTETRQPFHHLFTHFVEDLTHYDGAFWKTTVHLLFRPAKLTKEYLEGKRQTYVPPVKLYIFISFVTFFLMSTLPGGNFLLTESTPSGSEKTASKGSIAPVTIVDDNGFNSLEELEQYQKTAPVHKKLSKFEFWMARASFNVHKEESRESFVEAYIHTLPKVLFVYMPVFAFWLWLFHGKKRWYFFDHGIFTLHYFAFLLLLITIVKLVAILLNFINTAEYVNQVFALLAFIYAIFYFFRSHRLMYSERWWISALKCFAMSLINFTLVSVALMATMIYVLNNMH